MPRQPRLDAPGLLQHVMARGIERREIFKDDKDRQSFLDRLAIILEETQTQCFAWALIANHLLLRTGPTPLSTVMRRLMTGYAVVFNHRHRRAGHLFQDRYKSVVCEENPYLLELIRHIHLNPLRARLAADLNALDKYPWSGHSVLMGNSNNPLIPEMKEPPRPNQPNRPDQQNRPFPTLAEETIEEVLRHFGETPVVAREHYRRFVEKGIPLGRRPEFQGGGLIRSLGGKCSAFSEIKKGEKEKSDQRVLGSRDFVSATLQQSERFLQKKYQPKQTLDELIAVIAGQLRLSPELICSGSRQRKYSEARALIAYLAVEETGHPSADVARYFGINHASVFHAVKKAKIIFDENQALMIASQ